MVGVYRDPAVTLLGKLITPGHEPVTLVCPVLPSIPVLDHAILLCRQNGRPLRVVTSLYGSDTYTTRNQLDCLLRLERYEVKIKAGERGMLPSMLVVSSELVAILPNNWGILENPGFPVIVLNGDGAEKVVELGESIWRESNGWLSSRRLRTALKWVDEVATDNHEPDESPVEIPEPMLFEKKRKVVKKLRKADSWWTFHGTSDDRVNPFLSVDLWAKQRGAYRIIRFPKGRRPTSVKQGDLVYFVVLSRETGGEPEAYIVGWGRAKKYSAKVDELYNDGDNYSTRFPHVLELDRTEFIDGAIGEGVSAYGLMNELGYRIFEATSINAKNKKGNLDPHKSISQKTKILLSSEGSAQTSSLLNTYLLRLGSIRNINS
jgi:hypothetical protein